MGASSETIETPAQASIVHTNIPAGEPHHIVYPRVSASTRLVGVASATANRPAQSPSAIRAPAHSSARRRTTPIAATPRSAIRISSVQTVASVLDDRRTSNFRSHGEAGLRSHHGGAPTARTTACHPTPAPSLGVFAVAALTTLVRLPGFPLTWSISGGVQHATATTSAATAHHPTARLLRGC